MSYGEGASYAESSITFCAYLPAYVTIADLHDASGVKPILSHLISFGSARLRALQRSSILVKETIQRYNQVRHIKTNNSPLDVLS